MTIIIKEIRVTTTVAKTWRDDANPDLNMHMKNLKREIVEELKRKERHTQRKRHER